MSEETKTPASELTYDATIARLKDIADEVNRVAGKDEVSARDEEYLAELEGEFDELDEYRKKLERKALQSRVSVVSGRPLRTERSADKMLNTDPFGEPESVEGEKRYHNPWNLDEVRRVGSREEIASELRSRAFSAIERMTGTNDKRREVMTNILEEFDNDRGDLARQALATSSPEYVRAFAKLAKGQSEASLTDDERRAVQRAMSLTDSAGGYLVPFQLDPTVIITSDGSLNEIRRAARQVVATGDVWNGVSSGAVSFSWDAEGAEVSDDATTFAQPTIPVYKAAGFVPISIEALADAANVTQEVGRLLAFGKDTIEATAFATGTGSAQPTGIVTAVAAQATASATTDTFAIADVYALDSALPARYRPNASWLANRNIYNLIRQFDTAGGAGLWERLANDAPPNLLGRPAYEAEGMDGTITALAANLVLVYGDFSHYVIADRIGMSVEFIPHLFSNTTTRPSGQRGWYSYFRVGADSVNDTAFEILDVT